MPYGEKGGKEKNYKGTLGIQEHTDVDVFTLISENNSNGGLQVKVNGEWHSVSTTHLKNEEEKEDGEKCLVVNVGDALEHWTGGYWKSTRHRVLLPSQSKRNGGEPRQVLAFFAGANYDALLEPLQLGKGKGKMQRKGKKEILTYHGWRKRRIKEVVQQLRKLKP